MTSPFAGEAWGGCPQRAVNAPRPHPELGEASGEGEPGEEAEVTRRPSSVRRQTSQSTFSGLPNQGSAQPCAMQALTSAGCTCCPSSSNRGSLPPGCDN